MPYELLHLEMGFRVAQLTLTHAEHVERAEAGLETYLAFISPDAR